MPDVVVAEPEIQAQGGPDVGGGAPTIPSSWPAKLVEALVSPDAGIRMSAIKSLKTLAWSIDVLKWAAWTLARPGNTREERIIAAELLGAAPSDRELAALALTNGETDADHGVRLCVAEALGNLGVLIAKCVGTLLGLACSDTNAEVREEAAVALERLWKADSGFAELLRSRLDVVNKKLLGNVSELGHPGGEPPTPPGGSVPKKTTEELQKALVEGVRPVFTSLPTDAKDRLVAIAALNAAFRDMVKMELEATLDNGLRVDPPREYSGKQDFAKLANSTLHETGFSVELTKHHLPAGISAARQGGRATAAGYFRLNAKYADEKGHRPQVVVKTDDAPIRLGDTMYKGRFASRLDQNAASDAMNKGGR